MLVDGGGGGTSFDVDRGAASKALSGLVGAAEDLDAHGSSVPTSVDAGDAQGVLSDMVSALANAAGALAEQAGLVSEIGTEMLDNYGDVDAAVADVMARATSNLTQAGGH